MGVNVTDFDSFEQILLEFIGDFQSTSVSFKSTDFFNHSFSYEYVGTNFKLT